VLAGRWHSASALRGPRVPLNKQLWTSSYVLCTGGVAMLVLARLTR